MTEIRIIGGARRRKDIKPSRATMACLLGAAFLALFAAAALAADGLARFDQHCAQEDRV